MKRSLIFITALCAFPLGAMELNDDERELLEQIPSFVTIRSRCKLISEMCHRARLLKLLAQSSDMHDFPENSLQEIHTETVDYPNHLAETRRRAQEFWITRLYITHDVRNFAIGTCIAGFAAVFWTAHHFGRFLPPYILSWTQNSQAVINWSVGALLAGAYFAYRKNQRLLDEGLKSVTKIKEILQKDPRIIHWLASQQPSENPMPQPENPD